MLMFLMMCALTEVVYPATWLGASDVVPATSPLPALREPEVMVGGFAKSGTLAIATVFAQLGFSATWEPKGGEMNRLVLDYRHGKKRKEDLVDWLRNQHAHHPVQVQSHFLFADILPIVMDTFPGVKFILPLRWPIAWAESLYDQAAAPAPTFAAVTKMQLGAEDFDHLPTPENIPTVRAGLQILHDYGFPVYSFATMVKYYSQHVKAILETVPPGKLLLVETEALSTDSVWQQILLFVDPLANETSLSKRIAAITDRNRHAQNKHLRTFHSVDENYIAGLISTEVCTPLIDLFMQHRTTFEGLPSWCADSERHQSKRLTRGPIDFMSELEARFHFNETRKQAIQRKLRPTCPSDCGCESISFCSGNNPSCSCCSCAAGTPQGSTASACCVLPTPAPPTPAPAPNPVPATPAPTTPAPTTTAPSPETPAPSLLPTDRPTLHPTVVGGTSYPTQPPTPGSSTTNSSSSGGGGGLGSGGEAGVAVAVACLLLFTLVLIRRRQKTGSNKSDYSGLSGHEYVPPAVADVELTEITTALHQAGSPGWAKKMRSWEVPWSAIATTTEVLGKGAFGSVVRATCYGAPCAIKRASVSSANHSEKKKADKMLRTETRALAALHHPNIVRMLHVCVEPGFECVVLELAERGNLRMRLEEEPGMPLWLRFKFIAEVALGMAVLHRHRPKPIIHHDLKPENILISKDDEAKVADFGIATGTHNTTGVATTVASFGVAGTTPYMSPEKLQAIAGYQTLTSVDVYAWAIVAFETLTSEQAWPGLNKVQIVVKVVTEQQRPSIPMTMLPQLSKMIQSAWGQKRPSFDTLSERCCKLRTEIADLAPPRGGSGGVLTVVVSTSERAVNGEQVMEYVEAVAKLRDDLIFGYDWAGSSTGEVRDSTVDWNDPGSVKDSFWFTSYKGQIKAEVKTLVQLSSVSKLVLLCIEGGPITQLEAATMRQLKDEVTADLRSKNVFANIAVEIVPFAAFKPRFPPRAAPLASLIPTYWKQGVPSEGKFLFQLRSTDTQYKRAEAAFFQSAQSWRKIATIYLVQHPSKWQAYSSKRRILDQDLRSKGLVCGANEKETFHGARASSVPVILDQGFIREYNTVSAYGRGTYFARDASYSEDDRYSPPDPQNGGLKSMFIVRILVGEPCVGQSGMQKPSPKQDGTLHESMVDNVANPSIFVLSSGSDDHAYPEFLIRFR